MNFKFVVAASILAVAMMLIYQTVEEKVDAAFIVANAVAKTACTCVFVAKRPLEACRKDDPPGFSFARAWVTEADADDDDDDPSDALSGVSTSVMWVVRGRAFYRPNLGCQLE